MHVLFIKAEPEIDALHLQLQAAAEHMGQCSGTAAFCHVSLFTGSSPHLPQRHHVKYWYQAASLVRGLGSDFYVLRILDLSGPHSLQRQARLLECFSMLQLSL